MSFNIEQFDADKLQCTKEAWIDSADSLGIPSLDYDRILAWATTRIDYTNGKGDSFAYGIFPQGCKEAVAIVDLVYTSRSNGDVGWLKMLQVSLGPTLAPSQLAHSTERISEVLNVYSTAIIGTIQLTSDHKAKVVKLFGRDEDLLKLFIALNERLQTILENAHSKMEGRWLVISAH